MGKDKFSSYCDDYWDVNNKRHLGDTELQVPPGTKQEYRGAQYENIENQNIKNYKFRVTNCKNHFQEYLIKKGLNHQPMGEQYETNDLQCCLSSYTDLDVLDEDNKFICKACTAQKQCMLMRTMIMNG